VNKIINFGSLNLDHVYRVPHFVQPGETLSSTEYRQFCGGKGGNQSIALARAGAPVYHAGCVGPEGAVLTDNLSSSGVDISLIRQLAVPSGHAIIQVDQAGENSIILFPGANHAITAEHIAAVIASCRPGDLMLLQNEINGNAEIITAAAAAQMEVCLNFAPFDPAAADSLPLHLLRYLIINETEGAGLAGQAEPDAILNVLTQRFPATAVILTLGGKGVLCGNGSERIRAAATPAKVVDTTSAGDTFTGYFLAARRLGKSLQRSLEEGCAAAAVTVSRPGAADSIPRREELNLD